MTLPKINNDYIINRTVLPDSGKSVKYHTMRSKDAKRFLLLKSDVTFLELVDNMKAVLDSCSTGCNIDELTLTDMQWLFIKIRIASKGNESELNFVCNNPDKDGNPCGGKIKYALDLEKVDYEPIKEDRIEYVDVAVQNSKIRIYLKDIFVEDFEALADVTGKINPENLVDAVALSIDKIVEGEGDESIVHKEFTVKEITEFVDTLPVSTIAEIDQNFIQQSSSLSQKINLKCPKCGHQSSEVLKGIINFF